MIDRLATSRVVQRLMKYPRFSGALVSLFLLTIGTVIGWQNYRITQEKEEMESLEVLETLEQNLEQVMKQCYGALLTMALTVDEHGKPHQFEPIAAKIIEANEVISTLELVPGGVIKYIYPMEGNEPAMDYNILADPNRNADALKAIDHASVYFAGPIQLKQGGVAIVGRLPIFLKEEFWGFSAVIITLDDLLDEIGATDQYMEQFYLQFSKINPQTGKEEFFLPVDDRYPLTYSRSAEFPDGDWRFYLSRKERNYFSAAVILILACILSVFAGLFVTHLLKEPDRLQRLVERKSGELITSERKFRLLFEQASDGITIFDSTGRFLEANSRMEKLSGYAAEELKAMKNFDLVQVADMDHYRQLIEQLKRDKHLVYERDLLKKDGSIIQVEVSAIVLPDGHFQGIVRDISERKQNEELLKKAEEKFYHDVISAVEEEKQKFGQELHDGLGQLLSAISMHVSMLASELAVENDDVQVIGQKIRELSSKAIIEARSISHGLMSSFIRQNGLIISIREIGYQFQSCNGIEVRVDVEDVEEEDLSDVMKLNLYRITQELASNIIRHASATKMNIRLTKNEHMLILQIEDNGIGLTESKEKGIGLGNVYYRAKLIKGDINFRSEKGKGSQFTIKVPIN